MGAGPHTGTARVRSESLDDKKAKVAEVCMKGIVLRHRTCAASPGWRALELLLRAVRGGGQYLALSPATESTVARLHQGDAWRDRDMGWLEEGCGDNGMDGLNSKL